MTTDPESAPLEKQATKAVACDEPGQACRSVDALKAQVARRNSTISAYEARVAELDAEILGLKATTKSAQTRAIDLEFDLRRQEELVQELRGQLGDKAAAIEDGDKQIRTLEFTDEQVLAFMLAYDAGDAYEGVVRTRRVRAGLAAIQWPARESVASCGDCHRTHVPEDHKTAPEMREVPAKEKKIGDRATITGEIGIYRASPVGPMQPGDVHIAGWNGEDIYLYNSTLTVTRPASHLPDKPGAVGTATVRGRKNIRVHRLPMDDFGAGPWVTFIGGGMARWLDSDLSDYVPLLDGQEGNQ